MNLISNLKEMSFLIYGLGLTGQSVAKFFRRNNISNFKVWDDKNKNLYKKKRSTNLNQTFVNADFIVLSPGVSLNISKHKKLLKKFEYKIITDIDLLYLFNNNFKSIVVTGTNGKSTTCKLINHLLKKNKFKTLMGGNIGTPILDLHNSKNVFYIIEASSFHLAHSKYIHPDYAIFINISNDHLDWHGNMANYLNSKLKIFKLQKNNNYALTNNKIKKYYIKRNFMGKLIVPNIRNYKKIKLKIKNAYLKSNINDENMSYVFTISKLLNIKDNSFIKSMNTFIGLPHRYEVFLKKKNIIFINDSKATSFQSTKYALQATKNIFWIVGGLPKKQDKIVLTGIKKNIIKTYIIGKNINFFKKQIKDNLNFYVANNLRNSIIKILQDIKKFKKKNNIVLFSPAAASFDQFSNFEKRGEQFKKLSKKYARKFI